MVAAHIAPEARAERCKEGLEDSTWADGGVCHTVLALPPAGLIAPPGDVDAIHFRRRQSQHREDPAEPQAALEPNPSTKSPGGF